MLKVWVVAKREVLSLLVAPGSFVIGSVFLLISSYFFVTLVQFYQELVRVFNASPMQMTGEAPNLNLDVIEPYLRFLMSVLIFFLPLLSMRSIAEEKKGGTLELLLISPLSTSSIVLGKLLGLFLVSAAILLLALWAPLLLSFFVEIDLQALALAVFGLLLCILALLSLLLAVSAFSPSAVVAASGGMLLSVLLYMADGPAVALGGDLGAFLQYLTPRGQLESFIRGVFETKCLVYFLSVLLIGYLASVSALRFERWRT